MIFADKLVNLRKKAGWTQEELAERMGVSRQSIAKWEGAQSVPELGKMVKLSKLFGVSTDYLLKEELESLEGDGAIDEANEPPLRHVSMEEANGFLASRRAAAGPLALGVALCIVSPALLIFLSCMSESAATPVSEGLAVGLGMIALVLLIAAAVAVFMSVGSRNAQYEYLEKEQLDTEYGVEGLVRELRASYKPTYDRSNLTGVILCVFAILPLFFGMMVNEGDPMLMALMVCLLLALAAAGVYLFVRVGVVWASFAKLLQDGEYSIEKKKENASVVGAVSGAYWLMATAVYLAVSFVTERWEISWVIWAVAGVLYPAVLSILRAASRKEK